MNSEPLTHTPPHLRTSRNPALSTPSLRTRYQAALTDYRTARDAYYNQTAAGTDTPAPDNGKGHRLAGRRG